MSHNNFKFLKKIILVSIQVMAITWKPLYAYYVTTYVVKRFQNVQTFRPTPNTTKCKKRSIRTHERMVNVQRTELCSNQRHKRSSNVH